MFLLLISLAYSPKFTLLCCQAQRTFHAPEDGDPIVMTARANLVESEEEPVDEQTAPPAAKRSQAAVSKREEPEKKRMKHSPPVGTSGDGNQLASPVTPVFPTFPTSKGPEQIGPLAAGADDQQFNSNAAEAHAAPFAGAPDAPEAVTKVLTV